MSESSLNYIKKISKDILHFCLTSYGIAFIFIGAASFGVQGFIYRNKLLVLTSFFAFIYLLFYYAREHYASKWHLSKHDIKFRESFTDLAEYLTEYHNLIRYRDEKTYKEVMEKVEKTIGKNPLEK